MIARIFKIVNFFSWPTALQNPKFLTDYSFALMLLFIAIYFILYMVQLVTQQSSIDIGKHIMLLFGCVLAIANVSIRRSVITAQQSYTFYGLVYACLSCAALFLIFYGVIPQSSTMRELMAMLAWIMLFMVVAASRHFGRGKVETQYDLFSTDSLVLIVPIVVAVAAYAWGAVLQ